MYVVVGSIRDSVPVNNGGSTTAVDMTFRSSDKLYRQLHPYNLGPVYVQPWDEPIKAAKVENAWRFSGQYEGQSDEEHKLWSLNGFWDAKGQRYPGRRMDKPKCFRYKGEALSEVEARFKIFAPLYTEAVVKTDAYKALKKLVETGGRRDVLYLAGYGSYHYQERHIRMADTIYDAGRDWSHVFILACLLSGEKPWEEEYDKKRLNHVRPSHKRLNRPAKREKVKKKKQRRQVQLKLNFQPVSG